LKGKDKKIFGTINEINPDATTDDINMFIEGINGFRNSPVVYAYTVTENLVYEPEDEE
jgi:hypothetical protein